MAVYDSRHRGSAIADLEHLPPDDAVSGLSSLDTAPTIVHRRWTQLHVLCILLPQDLTWRRETEKRPLLSLHYPLHELL